MLEPTAYEAARHLAGVRARQAVRASFRPWFPRCGCGRFLTSAGACGRCDGAVAG